MKFFALAALVATTQAAASAAFAVKDADEGCAEGNYTCAITSCGTGGNDGDICLPDAITTEVDQKTKDITGAKGEYLTDETCATAKVCDAASSASALVASAAAVATAIYTLA